MEESVTQKHNFGCGAACVAFIANKKYSDIITVLGEEKANRVGFSCKELVGTFDSLGLFYNYSYLTSSRRVLLDGDGIIVFIRRSKEYPAGHFLARHKDLWMDPWINFSINDNINESKSGFRKKLPGDPIYILHPSINSG